MLALLLALTASASQFTTELSVEDLAVQSRAAVRGDVVHTETRATRQGLATRYTIHTDACLAGACPDEVHVLLPGGRQDGLVQRFATVPLWSVGDEVIVFLPPEGRPQSFQGLLTLRDDQIVDPVNRSTDLVPRTLPRLRERLAPGR